MCGLGHADVKDFNPDKYYNGGYFDGTHRDGYVDYQGSEAILKREFRDSLQHLRSFGVDHGSILEIGCAYGFFLDEASAHFSPYGIEIAQEAVAACHARGLAHVRQGIASAESIAPLPLMDAIVMLDVVEHLEQPREVLAMAVQKLRVGGTVMVTTGDFSSLCAKTLGKRWRLMTPPQHLWFFTPVSLAKIGVSMGLELVSVQHPWKLVPLSLICYQLTRPFGIQLKLHAKMSELGLPVNLFDAMRLVFKKTSHVATHLAEAAPPPCAAEMTSEGMPS